MATLTDIKSIDWQLSLAGAGNIVQGYEDVNQCIDVILRTQKGSNPLRPFFGSNIYNYIDAPVNAAIPNIKREIIEALALWETRIQIVNITHTLQGENILFFINYLVIDDDREATAQLLISKYGIVTTDVPPSALILEAIIPAGWAGQQLLLEFLPDGNLPAPVPPVFGFANPSVMLLWVRANWGYYGRWYLLPDRLVGFIRPGICRTATLNITVGTVMRYATNIPELLPGQQLQCIINQVHAIGGGIPSGPFTGDAVGNMALLLTWVQTNFFLGNVVWAIENVVTGGDFDSTDFDSTDFSTNNIQYVLVAYTTLYDYFDFEVNAV